MAKNVSITEDGNSKTIENAAKIRTSLIGGGTCDWIPKDDVPLQTLTVTEDGTYRPEQNYYGFSQVTARGIGNVIEGDLIEKTITKNGTYNIKDESGSPYGYSKIIVNIDTSEDDSGGDSGGGNAPIVGKDEDGNDTMAEADDDGNIVMTALPTDIKVIIPPTKLEYNRYEELDYSGISVYAYISKEIHWLGTTATAVTEGSSDNTVSIDDSNVTASVGDGILYAPDQTGQNDVQLVWDGTKWVKPSNYSSEKAIWKSDKYPTGKIPFDELIFPMKRCSSNAAYDASFEKRNSSLIDVDVISGNMVSYETSVDFGSYNFSPSSLLSLRKPFFLRVNACNSSNILVVRGRSKLLSYYGNKDDSLLDTTNSSSPFITPTIILAIGSYYDEVTAQISANFSLIYTLYYSYEDYPAVRKYYTHYRDRIYEGLFILQYDVNALFIWEGPILNIPHRDQYRKKGTQHIINVTSAKAIPITNECELPTDISTEEVIKRYSDLAAFTYDDTVFTREQESITYNGLTARRIYCYPTYFADYTDMEAEIIETRHRLSASANPSTPLQSHWIVWPLGSGWNTAEHGDKPPYYMNTRAARLAWTALYGNEVKKEDGRAHISLPVQWKRPGDGKILETTFTAWMKDDGGRAPGPQGGSGNYDVPQ